MEVNQDLQQSIITAIKEKANPAISLVDDMADCLKISKDSTYRRLRGEKMFDVEEVRRLTIKYNLSLDRILKHEKSTVTFNSQAIGVDNFTFEKYLESILSNLKLIVALPEKELLYSAKDIPIFHYFQFRELGAFKIYFWLRSYLNDPKHNSDFSVSDLPHDIEKLLGIGEEIWKTYVNIPNIEIWSEETINVSLRQIQYYYEIGVLTSDDAKVLCGQFEEMLDRIKIQTEESRKRTFNSEDSNGGVYKVYLSEVAIGDNAILFKMGDKKISFLTFNNLNFISTSDENFCNLMDKNFTNMTDKSILISATAEKERNKFFNSAREKVLKLRVVCLGR